MNESVAKALPMISGVTSLIVAAATAGYVVGSLDVRVEQLKTDFNQINRKLKEHEEKINQYSSHAGNLPSGTILAMFSWSGTLPHGWVICGKDKETPDLNGRFLFGTTDISNLAKKVGSMPHEKFSNLRTTGEKRGRHQQGRTGTESDYADNIPDGRGVKGNRNWHHEHDVKLAITSENSENYLPPATQVLFLCKPGSTRPAG